MLIRTHELTVDEGNEQVYNGMDCCLTAEVFLELNKQRQSAEPAYSFELALQAPVLEMMLRGFLVDAGARELALKKVDADLLRLDHIIQTISQSIWNKEINPNSGHQLKALFYNHLGIQPIAVFKKGELTYPMDRSVMEQIENYFQARPFVTAILAHRDLTKQKQVLETEVDRDWRMRTSYNIGGTKAARFSSSASPTGTGGNLQNVSEELRHVFIPDPGYVLCGIDAEQSDSRMVGFICGVLFDDWRYLDACESGDLHTAVARMVWEKELPWTDDLKKNRAIAERKFHRHFSYRDCCKRIGHGRNFYGKPQTLAKETSVPVPLVKRFCESYSTAFPAIERWQIWTAAELQTKKRLVTIHGRHRDFFDRTEADETLRKGLAFLAAAPTADNLNLGMWRIWRHMPEVQLLAQVHDAVYFQFPDHFDKKATVQKAQKLLETELRAPNGRQFIVPSEAKLGYNWGNYDEKKNPRGLKKFKPN